MKRLGIAAGVTAIATVAAEVALRAHAHPVLPWHEVPAFDLVYGLAGCALIVYGSKALGRAFVQRPEERGGDAP